jgi:ribosomal protein S18 acetylase RimI-like enzyme
VLPEYSDKSIGRLLLEYLEKKVGHRKTIKVVTDPNSLSFFRKYGYHKVGEAKSKPDGMSMPILKKIIERKSEQ